MLLTFTYGSQTHVLTCPDDADTDDIKHWYLLGVDPQYRWLSFRRALLSSPEYPLAVALALESTGLALADAKLTSAIDACLNQGAEPEEVAAFQSALALYFGQLPTPEGVPIRDRIINLCIEHNIPYPDPAPGG